LFMIPSALCVSLSAYTNINITVCKIHDVMIVCFPEIYIYRLVWVLELWARCSAEIGPALGTRRKAGQKKAHDWLRHRARQVPTPVCLSHSSPTHSLHSLCYAPQAAYIAWRAQGVQLVCTSTTRRRHWTCESAGSQCALLRRAGLVTNLTGAAVLGQVPTY
jgi:hypothetical protein